MSKLSMFFYLFSLLVLALFGVFSYLMSTVNPESIPSTESPVDNVPDPPLDKDEPTDPASPSDPPADPPLNPPAKRTMTGTTLPDREFPDSPDLVSGALTVGDRNPINETKLAKSFKERRSVNDMLNKKNKGIVIMKIFGDHGKPRIEIVLHPKQMRDIRWKNNIEANNLYQKQKEIRRRKAEFIYNSVVNVMPDDTVILENADYSLNRVSGKYTKISETMEISQKTRNNMVTKSVSINALKTQKHDLQMKTQSPVRNRFATNVTNVETTVEIESRRSNHTERKSNNIQSTQAALGSQWLLTTNVKINNVNRFTENTTKKLTTTHSLSFINDTEAARVTAPNVINMISN